MAGPTIIEIPHDLGREEARRRMAIGIGKLASHIPGGAATVTHSWLSQDHLSLTVATMGVEVPCTVHAHETSLHVTVQLPAMVCLMSAPIKAIIQQQGERLLLDKKPDQTA
ncbi:polyhydroxyalkanoic acid system family protein [Sphingobium sp. B2]|uniref:polyhydroxyalkanoic acid system family protein n=1 Tax=Sphingobium sp. B2 TaxID=2583228 RepID=UPI0011A5CE7A|nr:polyhydroxyalkanoic acid system family protein [Sphingobium sp. B2]